MALNALTLNASAPVNWNAQNNVNGASPNQNASSSNEAICNLSSNAADNAPNGADDLYYAIQTIAASGSLSLDLTTFTNVLGVAASVAARVKYIKIGLLSAAQDSVNGTLCTFVKVDATVVNGLASQSGSGWLEAVSILDIPNSGWVAFGIPNANGIAVDSTHKVIKITNGDSSHAAAVKIVLGLGDS